MPWTVCCPSYRQPLLPILSTLLNSSTLPISPVLPNSPTVSLCHPSTVSSSLGQSLPKPQLSSAYCCASCCVLPHTHSADFRYCHASCHPVATVQQCFSSAYALTDFNPVTGILYTSIHENKLFQKKNIICIQGWELFNICYCYIL